MIRRNGYFTMCNPINLLSHSLTYLFGRCATNISWRRASLVAAVRCSARFISTFCLFQIRIFSCQNLTAGHVGDDVDVDVVNERTRSSDASCQSRHSTAMKTTRMIESHSTAQTGFYWGVLLLPSRSISSEIGAWRTVYVLCRVSFCVCAKNMFCPLTGGTRMARACVTDAGDQQSSSSYLLGVRRLQKQTMSTKKKLLDTIKRETNVVRSRRPCSREERMASACGL